MNEGFHTAAKKA